MNSRRTLVLFSALAFVLVSSGCMGQGSGSEGEAQKLVKEGNILNYSSGDQQLSLVLFNETESSIGIGISTSAETRKFYKGNWTTSSAGSDFLFFLSSTLSMAEDGKIESLMSEGKTVSVDPSGVTSANISRSEMYEWRGYKAYNVTFDGENSEETLIYHAREPYVLLSASSGSQELELSSVGSTDSPEKFIGESSLIEDTEGEVEDAYRAQNTDLQLTPVYVNSSGSEDQIMVRVTNTGDRAVNTSEFTIYFGPPNFPNPVTRSILPEDWKVGDGNSCFTESQIIAQGDYVQCETGVRFPNALESVEILVRADEFEYEEGVTCAVESSGARTC